VFVCVCAYVHLKNDFYAYDGEFRSTKICDEASNSADSSFYYDNNSCFVSATGHTVET